MSPDEIDARFRVHVADADRLEAHEQVRVLLGAVARELSAHVPDGREKSLVLTKLEEAMFWANAGIARHR